MERHLDARPRRPAYLSVGSVGAAVPHESQTSPADDAPAPDARVFDTYRRLWLAFAIAMRRVTPRWSLALPFVALGAWTALITVGGLFLGWRA